MADTFTVDAISSDKIPIYVLSFYGERRNSKMVTVMLAPRGWSGFGYGKAFPAPRKWAEERKDKAYYITPDEAGYRFTEVPDA